MKIYGYMILDHLFRAMGMSIRGDEYHLKLFLDDIDVTYQQFSDSEQIYISSLHYGLH